MFIQRSANNGDAWHLFQLSPKTRQPFVSLLLSKSHQSSENFFAFFYVRKTSTWPTQQKVDALSLAVNLPFIDMLGMPLIFSGLSLLWKGAHWMKCHCLTFDMGIFFSIYVIDLFGRATGLLLQLKVDSLISALGKENDQCWVDMILKLERNWK